MIAKIKNYPSLVGTAAFAITAWGYAFSYVALNDWFGASDLQGFAFWVLIFSVLTYPILEYLVKKTAGKTALSSYGLALLTSLAITIIFILLMLFLLGAWIGAFSFPVLFCLLIGASIGSILSVYIQRPSTWVSAIFSVSILPIIFSVLVSIYFTQPDDLLITVSNDIPPQQINKVWNKVIKIDGVQGMARVDRNGETRLLVDFDLGLSETRRGEIVSQIDTMAFIINIENVENE